MRENSMILAIRVAIAAPTIPRAGKPNKPKINIKLSNVFTKIATIDIYNNGFVVPVSLNVLDIATDIIHGNALHLTIFK